jgi:hypothetical protein
LAVGSWQLAVGSWQLAVGSWQLAVGSWQLAVGSWQLAVGSWHWSLVSCPRWLFTGRLTLLFTGRLTLLFTMDSVRVQWPIVVADAGGAWRVRPASAMLDS